MTAFYPEPDMGPLCTRCRINAADMAYLDSYLIESLGGDLDGVPADKIRRERIKYVEQCDGSYNPETSHFWCDPCYVMLGAPAGVAP